MSLVDAAVAADTISVIVAAVAVPIVIVAAIALWRTSGPAASGESDPQDRPPPSDEDGRRDRLFDSHGGN